jgi:hypothetical protein
MVFDSQRKAYGQRGQTKPCASRRTAKKIPEKDTNTVVPRTLALLTRNPDLTTVLTVLNLVPIRPLLSFVRYGALATMPLGRNDCTASTAFAAAHLENAAAYNRADHATSGKFTHRSCPEAAQKLPRSCPEAAQKTHLVEELERELAELRCRRRGLRHGSSDLMVMVIRMIAG